jgi:hypothetical protein
LATNVEEIASRGNAKNWNCLVRECTPPSGTFGDLPNTRGWAAHEISGYLRAGGAVGQILALGAKVIGFVCKETDAERAKGAGCDEVLI